MSVAADVGAPESAGMVPPYPAALSISGPSWHSPLAHGRQVPLLHPEIHIGLLEANDVVLADLLASRMHAVIRWTPAGYAIQDLNSTNGTFVQGQRITGPTILTPGQHIRIGGTDLLFQALQVQDAAPSGGATSAPPAYGQAAAPGVATIPTQVLNQVAAQAAASRPRRWLARQRDKRYWRVFLTGLAAYIVSSIALSITDNPHMVPLVLLLASALVPVTFVIFCWEAGAFGHMPATVVGLTFISGAVLGLVVAALLEPVLVVGAGFDAALMVGVCEESAKALAVLWFLRDKRLRSELDGLVLGAAAGMGFAALETAGYGFASFLGGFADALGPNAGLATLMNAGIGAMTGVLVLRMALAVFGHGVWTAIVGAAIWRERGQPTEHRVPSILLAFVIAIVLHALWDTSLLTMPISALAGIFLLRFFIRESVERAKLGPDAPPPAPLAAALGHYCRHAFQRFQRPLAQPAAFATAPQPFPGAPTAYPPFAPPQTTTSTPPYAAPPRQAPAAPAATPPLGPLPSAAMPSGSSAPAPSVVPAPATPPETPAAVATEPPTPPDGQAAPTVAVSEPESMAAPGTSAAATSASVGIVAGSDTAPAASGATRDDAIIPDAAAMSVMATEGPSTPVESSTAPVEPPTAATETHGHRPAHHRSRSHHAVEDAHEEAAAMEQAHEEGTATTASAAPPEMAPAAQPELTGPAMTADTASATTVPHLDATPPGAMTPQPATETVSAPTFCGHCGARVAPGATFCGHCGTSLRV